MMDKLLARAANPIVPLFVRRVTYVRGLHMAMY